MNQRPSTEQPSETPRVTPQPQSSTYWWPLMADCVSYEERKVLADFIVKAPRLTYGEEILQLERDWCAWNGSNNSLFVNSGTSANYLIIAACKVLYGWQPGQEVLVPAVTWGTTISSLMNLGIRPVPVDIDTKTLSMDLRDAKSKVTTKTKAVFLTHLLGIPHDMDAVLEFARAHDLLVLEDSCESHGACWKNKKIGNFGLASSFSFYWGHHITTIEGGMVCTPDAEFADMIRSLRNHGLTRDMQNGRAIEQQFPEIDKRFLFWQAGFNSRGTETYAKLGQLQLKNLTKHIDQRNDNYRSFVMLAGKYSKFFTTFYPPLGGDMSCFALAFLFHSPEVRAEISQVLEKNGIETRPLVTGNLTKQPFMKDFVDAEAKLPGAELIHTCGMYIGNNQFIDREHLSRLDSILEAWVKTK